MEAGRRPSPFGRDPPAARRSSAPGPERAPRPAVNPAPPPVGVGEAHATVGNAAVARAAARPGARPLPDVRGLHAAFGNAAVARAATQPAPLPKASPVPSKQTPPPEPPLKRMEAVPAATTPPLEQTPMGAPPPKRMMTTPRPQERMAPSSAPRAGGGARVPAVATHGGPSAAPGGGDEPRGDGGEERGGGGKARRDADPDAVLAALAATPPSAAVAGVAAARGGADRAFAAERATLAANPPALDRPSGLPRRGEPAPRDEAAASPERAARPATTTSAPPPRADTTHVASTAPLPAPSPRAERALDATPDSSAALAQHATAALDSMPTGDESVDTEPGAPPHVELSGESDPAQMDEALRQHDEPIDRQQQRAAGELAADEGENDIHPTVPHETLRGKVRGGGAAAGAAGKRRSPPAPLPPEARAALDSGAAGKWSAALADASAKNDAAKQQRSDDEAAARADTDAQIAALTRDAVADQTAQQRNAKREVAAARGAWQGELHAAEQRYHGKAATLKEGTQREIAAHQKKAESDAELEYARARGEAQRKKEEAERDAAAEKARKKKESKGFFGWLKSSIKSFFDAIKAAVKKIFSLLREAVKVIIEKAKKLVVGWIEAARKLIVGALHAFGALLMVAADVFLAAFPTARAKAKAWIRRGIAVAERGVNRAADWLKAGVSKLLDALGAVLTFVLDIYEKVYLFMLDVAEAIAVGIVEIIEGLMRLAESAKLMPDHFWGQFSEEGLGVDLTEPLPIEKPAQTTPAATVDFAQQAGAPLPTEDLAVAAKPTLDEKDVAVDNVATPDFPPEFFRELQLKEGEEREFGDNPNADASPRRDAEPADGGAAPASPATTETPAPDAASAPAPAPAAKPETDPATMTPDQQIDFLNSQPSPHVCDMPKTAEPAKESDIPAALRVYGPFTKWQRFKYFLHQIKEGISQWWKCNRTKIIIILVLALLGFVALLILTGGAILALIPPLLEIIATIMIGVAIARATSYVGDFIKQAWNGEKIPGAKSLARGLAILLIELISALIFNIGDVIKSAKGGLKAIVKDVAALAKNTVKTTIKNVAKVGKALLASGKAILKNGKLFLKGLRTGFGKGVKSLRELAGRLWSAVRFRKFKIRIRNRWLQVLGYFNPWVVIMEGPLKEGELPHLHQVEEAAVKGKKLGATVSVVKDGKTYEAKLVSFAKDVPEDYRAMFDAFKGAEHPDDVLHHLIERTASKEFEIAATALHHPSNLTPIPKGFINSIVHLSEIRLMWNAMYESMRVLLVGVKPEQYIAALAKFRDYTRRMIDEALAYARVLAQEGKLTREAMDEFRTAWRTKPGNDIKAAVREAIEAGRALK